MIDISIVIPVYNSAEIFPELHRRLRDMLTGHDLDYEIVAVVDGTADGSADVVAGICEQDARLKMIEFARNFGHQAAVTAGMNFARGQMVVVMDDDLEDPPEVIPRLIKKADEGFNVVYGIRRSREVSGIRRTMFHLFYRVMNALSPVRMPLDAGDFCLMKRPVVESLNGMPERNRYIRGLRAWIGFEQTGVPYDRDPRYAGKSGYNWLKYIGLALDGILSFSYRPLQYVSIVGGFVALISFVLGIRLIVLVLLDRLPDVPGWASLMVVTTFLGGVQLIAVGIIGQYIARIYDEVKGRPNYVIKRQIGLSIDD